jgi:pimeloyl-ACP methyl ester carboxylesterase
LTQKGIESNAFVVTTGLAAIGRIDTAKTDKPLLICLHGGGYNSKYFDIDGQSFLADAADHGFNAIALDRPGYGASSAPASGHPSLPDAAQTIGHFLESVWEGIQTPCPGIVLVGHSIGGAIAIHLAATPQRWPLLGISLSGLGHMHTHPDAPRIGAAQDTAIQMPAAARRLLLLGPDWTLQESITDRCAVADAPAPVAELIEIENSWPREFTDLAARVSVPAHFAAAEFETLWKVDPRTVAEFAAAFSAAPFVVGDRYCGVGHCIDHHALGYAWHLEQLAFSLRCAVEKSRPATQ